MKKTLVQLNNLEEHICRAHNKVYADGSIILTPGAKDELARRGIAVVTGGNSDPARAVDLCADWAACAHAGSCARAAASGCRDASGLPSIKTFVTGNGEADIENLLLGLAAILKNDYGVDDPKQLKELSLRALTVIKENV